MNLINKYKIILVPFVVIVLLVVVYAIIPTPKDNLPTKEESFQNLMTLEEAYKTGGELECTWQKDEWSFGKAYIKNANVYAETIVEDDFQKMLVKDACVYRWQVTTSEGTKECFDPASFAFSPPTGPRDTLITYSCERATIPESLITPPEEVRFYTPEELF